MKTIILILAITIQLSGQQPISAIGIDVLSFLDQYEQECYADSSWVVFSGDTESLWAIMKEDRLKLGELRPPKKLTEEEKLELASKIQPGFVFVLTLKDENDWHYVGRDVKLGDGNSPICWYKPTDSETYRVIYGDLSVADVEADKLPE